ncbi:MAG: hypothetical protein GXP27_03550 [Planctomycetes bacterium]|nr:hypothetical protein [Planctomycetota bacterium]
MMDQTGRRGTIPLSEFLPPDQVYLRRAASGLDQPASSRTGMPRGALPTPTPEMGEEDLGAPPAVPVEQFADAMGPGAPAIAAPRWGDATGMRQASAVNDRALEWGREERERAARRQAEAMRQVREMQEQQMEAFTEPSAPVIDGDWPEKERQEPTGSMEASPYTAKMDEGMPASQAIMELQDDTLVCDNCKSTFSSRDYKVGDPCPKCNHMTTIKRVRAIKGLVYLILLFGGGIAALVRRMTG